jgi:hypothetical protein
MDFLDRIGQLNIPTGLQGSQGPAGTNGAGWTSGAGNPISAPAADIKYYLNTVSGQIFEWNGSLPWDPVGTTIKGTNGNVWFTGVVNPNTITVAGAVVNDFFLDTVLGNIYKLVGVSWVLQLTIKGTPGTAGVNGTGLLDSFGLNTVTYNPNASYQPLNALFTPSNAFFNAFDGFPTIGSVVRSTVFVKARYLTSLTSITSPNNAELFIKPRIIGTPSFGPYDLNTNSVDQDSIDLARKLNPPNAIVSQPILGQNADTSSVGYARVEIPRRGTSNNYPYVYIKITTTLRRNGATTLAAMVEYTTTSRYGTYTAVYDPSVAMTMTFSSTENIGIEYIGDILIPSDYTATCQVSVLSHFVEKIIL